ncbi:MAG: recombinase family protein, partial [Lachnospirales bacterium]
MERESLHIGYVRVSTDEQAQHGYSIDFQKKRLKEKFESMNISDYLILVDEGVSGKSLKRPKMSKAVDWIKEQEVE